LRKEPPKIMRGNTNGPAKSVPAKLEGVVTAINWPLRINFNEKY
jgi:hypothetical protein